MSTPVSPYARIAIVAASPRIVGGHSVQAQRMLEGWRDDPAVRAWLVPIDPPLPRPLASAARVRYVRTLVNQLAYWPSLWRGLRHADVVHVFSASYTAFMLAAVPAIVVARLLRRPVVLNYHSGEAPDHLRRSWMARLILRRLVTLNVVPSIFLQRVFSSFDLPTTVVGNSIDLERFAFRSRNPIRPRLVSSRNLEPLYNVACTLRAFRVVQQRWPEACLTVVGDGSERLQLQALTTALGLRGVSFAGRVAHADMPNVYADADIYVQSPNIDNMPLSVLEAFASGLPVVSTAVGGVPTILTNDVHGLLVPPDNADALARAILDILEHPDAARARAETARTSCKSLDWAVIRNEWVGVYRTALHRGSRAGSIPEAA